MNSITRIYLLLCFAPDSFFCGHSGAADRKPSFQERAAGHEPAGWRQSFLAEYDNKPRVCDHAWISYLTGGDTNRGGFGNLTAGDGARENPAEAGDKTGPEFTFGIAMDAALDEPVLPIKTAWGGKSLYHDFRPPGAAVSPRTLNVLDEHRVEIAIIPNRP